MSEKGFLNSKRNTMHVFENSARGNYYSHPKFRSMKKEIRHLMMKNRFFLIENTTKRLSFKEIKISDVNLSHLTLDIEL